MQERHIQTRIKHEILREYLGAWGGIIVSSLEKTFKRLGSPPDFSSRFIYVDCMAFTGTYTERETLVYGSPIVGVEALERHRERAINIGFELKTTAILFEANPKNYRELLTTLSDKGYSNRIREVVSPAGLSSIDDGEIITVNAKYQEYVPALLRCAELLYTWSFFLVDPYGASGIPLDAVKALIRQEKADVIINFPLYHIQKLTGAAFSSTPNLEQQVNDVKAAFGTMNWSDLKHEYQGEELSRALADLYQGVLRQQDTDLAVKQIPLRFPDKERTVYYLFLTTHDGTGGLAMNRILDGARLKEYDARVERRRTQGGQMTMPGFEDLDDVKRPELLEADVSEVANEIAQRCHAGEAVYYREILKRVVDTPYYRADIRKAMFHLKNHGVLDFTTPLRNSTLVSVLK